MEQMEPSRQMGYLLQHVAFSLARQCDQVLQERLGFGMSQYKLMMILRQNPNVQQKYIADALGQTEASISRQIKLMHEQGLLQTSISPQNRREHITTLTAKGERMTSEAQKVLKIYVGPTFEKLGAKRQKQFMEILRILHDEVCKGDKPGRCYQTYLDSLEKKGN